MTEHKGWEPGLGIASIRISDAVCKVEVLRSECGFSISEQVGVGGWGHGGWPGKLGSDDL